MAYTTTGDLRVGDVHIPVTLNNIAIAFSDPNFIGTRLLPIVEVSKQSDKYPIYTPDLALNIEPDEFGPESDARRVELKMSRDQYYCEGHALSYYLADQVWQNADDPGARRLLEMRSRLRRVKQPILRRQEQTIATMLCTSGNYHTDLTADLDGTTTAFNDSGINGVKSILGWIDDLNLKCGATPDQMRMWISGDVWEWLASDTNFRPALTTSTTNSLESIRALFGFKEVLVARSIYNSANEGQAQTRARLWTSNCMGILVSPDGASTEEPATGYTFSWNGVPGASAGQVVQSERKALRGGGGEEVQYINWYHAKLTGLDSSDKIITGYLARNVYDFTP